jgi:glycerophosphoryl diester phosphodiesterase
MPTGTNPWRRSAPLAMAHRGQRATMPEQTLEAYAAAIQLGCDAIECDVQQTADGRLVMLHDLALDRTTDGHGPVAAASWDIVRTLDAGAWFTGTPTSLRVPTLEQALDLAVGAGVPLCIEIKGRQPDASVTAAAVARLLASRDLVDRMLISSFDHDALAVAASTVPGVHLAPESLPERGMTDPATAVGQASALGATVLQHRWEDLTVEVVEALHAADVAVWSWPIDSEEAVRHSVAVGVDGVIGDDVPLLLRFLGRTPPVEATASPR